MTIRTLFIAASLVVLTGCDEDTTELQCQANIPGIALTIVDSITGSSYSGPAVVVAKDGTFIDSLNVLAVQRPTLLAMDRAGFYTVTIKTPDHFGWSATNVLVTQSGCGVNTVSLTARMRVDTATSTFHATYSGRGEFADPTLVRVQVQAGSFTLGLNSSQLWPHEFTVPTSGPATARFSLVTASGDTLGTAQLSFTLGRNIRYGISGYVHVIRPIGACVGSVTPVPLRRGNGLPAVDSLFVMFLGLPRGAIC